MTFSADQLQEAIRVCGCFNLRRASRAATRLYDSSLGSVGLTSGGFVTLALVEIAPDVSLPELARMLGVDRSTLTRNLRPLIRGGLVRSSAPRVGRTVRVRLTPRGLRALERGIPAWKAAQERFEAAVGGAELARLLASLTQVSTTLRAP